MRIGERGFGIEKCLKRDLNHIVLTTQKQVPLSSMELTLRKACLGLQHSKTKAREGKFCSPFLCTPFHIKKPDSLHHNLKTHWVRLCAGHFIIRLEFSMAIAANYIQWEFLKSQRGHLKVQVDHIRLLCQCILGADNAKLISTTRKTPSPGK